MIDLQVKICSTCVIILRQIIMKVAQNKNNFFNQLPKKKLDNLFILIEWTAIAKDVAINNSFVYKKSEQSILEIRNSNILVVEKSWVLRSLLKNLSQKVKYIFKRKKTFKFCTFFVHQHFLKLIKVGWHATLKPNHFNLKFLT